MNYIGQYCQTRENNFNLMRMVAASCVLISHSFAVATGNENSEPLISLLPAHNLGLGRLAVCTFFIVSGFFISQSFERRHSLIDYFTARVLRIYPGLLAVLVIVAFVVGPLFTNVSLSQYFGSTGPEKYVLKGLSLKYFSEDLPGVFAIAPFPGATNISLWTLFFEFLCYFLVALLGLATMRGKRVFAAFMILYACYFATFSWLEHKTGYLSRHWFHARLHEVTLPFVLGMLYYRLRDNVPLSPMLATLASIGAVGVICAGFSTHLFVVLWSYLVMYLGFWRSATVLSYNKLGDYSYGTYIYAWPVQQMVAVSVPGISPLALIVIALPVSVLLGVVSWHVLEKPALEQRSRVALYLRNAWKKT